MTITFVGGFTGGVSTTVPGAAVTGNRSSTTGNFIASAFSDQNAASSAWTHVGGSEALTTLGRRLASGDSIECAYRPNITGNASDNVSANSGSQFKSCSAGEFAGVATSSPLDVENHTSGGTTGAYTAGNTISCPAVTTTQAGDLVIGVVTVESGASGVWSGVGSWVVASSCGDASVSSTSVVVYQIVGAAGSYTPQCSFNQNGTAVATCTAAFKDATAATAVDGSRRRASSFSRRISTSFRNRLWLPFKKSGDALAVVGVTVVPTEFLSSWTFPAPTVSGGASAAPSAFQTSWTFPSPAVSGGATVSPAAFQTAWTFPAPTVTVGATVSPAAFQTAWTFGSPTVLTGAVAIPSAFQTAWAFGSPTVSGGATVNPSAFNTAWTFGSPTVIVGATPNPPAFMTAWTFPGPTVDTGSGGTGFHKEGSLVIKIGIGVPTR